MCEKYKLLKSSFNIIKEYQFNKSWFVHISKNIFNSNKNDNR